MSVVPPLSIDQEKLDAFMAHAVTDMGAAMNTALAILDGRLGLYKAMLNAGPLTSTELAHKTGTDERYVREWLCAQAAGGYVALDPLTGRFELPPEQVLALAVEDSPCFLPGGFQLISSMIHDEPKIR